jgi:hypothetical protein
LKSPPLALALDFDADLLSLPEEGGFRVDAALALEFMYRSSLCLMVSLPCGLRLAESEGQPARLEAATGDPGLDLDLSFRLAAWRLSAGLGLSLPLGPTLGQGELVTSLRRGCPSLAIKTGILRFLDPLVLGLAFDASIPAPRTRREAALTGPLSLALRLSASEVLNPRLALSLALTQGLRGPSYADGKPESSTWVYSVAASAVFSLSLEGGSLRIGFSEATGLRLGASWTGE